MVDFRKALLVLLVLVFTASFASAQLTSPLSCTANAGVPPPVRSEGLAEEIGQITITCNGGSPTAKDAVLPTVNVQLFLNTNVTSRLIAGSSDSRTEALLLIDEPKPVGAARNMTDVIEAANDTVGGNGLFDIAEAGTQLVATETPLANANIPVALGKGVYGGGKPGRPNVFVGQYNLSGVQPSLITWLNIPFDPPGTTNNRVLRIVNVRAKIVNGSFPPASGLVPASVTAYLSISGTGGLALSQQTLTVAYVQQSLTTSVSHIVNPQLCLPYNAENHYFNLNFTELFGTAFRQKINTANAQAVPGTIYNTESMFYNPDFLNTQALDAGKASRGTKLMAKFLNVPAGVTLIVNKTIVSQEGDSAALSSEDGGWTSLSSTQASVNLDANRAGVIVYEVTTSIPGFISTVVCPVWTKYTVTATPDVVAYVGGYYAPQSTYGTPTYFVESNLATGVPRFFQDTTINYRATFQIKSCQTNLLFPWVAYVKGQNWDTGFAIANTTNDLWSTAAQYGTCSLNYFSAQGNLSATTPVVQAGTVFTATMSAGDATGTVKPFASDYAGYMIASCKFQMAHAYAFLTNGVTAEGYLALVLDGDMFYGNGTRTGVNSEKLVH